MTIGLWGPADTVMFPIIPHHVGPLLRGPSLTETCLPPSPRSPRSPRSSATTPSPASSPVVASGGCFSLSPGSPSRTGRATSTPRLTACCPSPCLSPPPPAGVVASEDLPLHAATRAFSAREVIDVQAPGDIDSDQGCLRLRLTSDGHLEAAEATYPWPRWVRAVRWADDCHSVNVQVQRDATDLRHRLRLRTVRPVARGHRLQLWFADDLLASLRVPFLAPHNIQGEKRYVCHRCGRTFEFPNPLKLHLSLDCGREGADELWRRLAHEQEDSASHSKKASAFRPYCGSSASFGSLSSSSSSGSNGSLFNSFHHFSIMAASGAHPALFGAAPPAPVPMHSALPLGMLGQGHHPATRRDAQHQTNITSYHQQASDMETLVSNLGRSKQGHLCIYCGKVYSRKYGLKIHIRTHTGFKPLKCKYCLRPFGDPSNLNKHVRLHAEGDTPYKCELCGKVLVRRRDLERHVKSRHQDGGDWDPDNDPDDVDVEVDEDTNEDDGGDADSHFNSSNASLGKSRPDIAIPTV